MDLKADLIKHLKFFAELGVGGVSADTGWRGRSGEPRPATETPAPTPSAPQPPAPAGARVPAASVANPIAVSMFDSVIVPVARSAAEALALIRDELGDCTRCKLHKLGRRQIVFGVGSPDADLMFVGEAPGHDEDVQGIPFVGRAGQLLTRIIESIGLRRDDVYIANVIKCRPPDNRSPEPDEIQTCQPFLFAQVDAIKPKVIVALGTVAARVLLNTEDPISRLRGRVYEYRGAKLIPTFHPAFLLRSPDRKRDVWEDMKKVRALLKGE